MKTARMMEVFQNHMMTMGMSKPENTMMIMHDTPMEVQICNMDKVMMISDGHHTVCCEMTKECMMNYKKKTDAMPMKKMMGKFVTMMRYTPKVEMHSETNMTMTMQIYAMEPYPTEETTTKMIGTPKPMNMDTEMTKIMEMAYRNRTKMMMKTEMDKQEMNAQEDILAGQTKAKKKMMEEQTNQMSMMNCMQMREMEYEIDMEARKAIEEDKMNQCDSDGEVDPEVRKKEMDADEQTLIEFEKIMAQNRIPTINKKKMESKPQAKVTKKLNMDMENTQTKQTYISATSQKGMKEMTQITKKRMTQEGEMTKMAETKKIKMSK